MPDKSWPAGIALTLIVQLLCRFPIFLTMAHLAFGFIALAPVMALPQFATRHEGTLRSHWRGIACVGAFKVGNTGT